MTSTRKSGWIAGIATIALALGSAAYAQGNNQGKGNGNGNKGGGPPAAKVERGQENQGNRGNRAERRDNRQDAREDRRDRIEDRVERRIDRAEDRADRRADRFEDRLDRRADRIGDRVDRFDDAGPVIRVRNRDGIDIDVGYALPDLRRAFVRDRRIIDGCPPGLAKKRNGCLPPGQARQRYRSYDPGFFGLAGLGGQRYFYDDGYLLSYRGDGLAGYLPLLGGALGIGNVWPSFYEPRPLPGYYQDFYGLGDPRGYRFADDVIYRVDPESAAILSVAALLTGDDIVVGQPMPRGYDVYNVPYEYRETYYDRPDARYRYSDGYIYEIDPETALVVAAIDLIA